MNRGDVDSYLADGCGRCERYRTPSCKVHRWTEPLKALRELLLRAGLTEEMKWGSPCYTLEGENVAMLASLEEHCGLSFFEGALLADERGLLERPGPNTRAARVLRFTSADQVRAQREAIRGLIEQAAALARAGAKVERGPTPEPVPEELQRRLDSDPELEAAFAALTPGRRRSFILHVSGAKRSETRVARVERCVPKILTGRGFDER